MHEKYYVIFSQKLAGYLMLNGIRLIFIRPDKHNENKNVFIFKNTDELKEKIKEYKIKKIALNNCS